MDKGKWSLTKNAKYIGDCFGKIRIGGPSETEYQNAETGNNQGESSDQIETMNLGHPASRNIIAGVSEAVRHYGAQAMNQTIESISQNPLPERYAKV